MAVLHGKRVDERVAIGWRGSLIPAPRGDLARKAEVKTRRKLARVTNGAVIQEYLAPRHPLIGFLGREKVAALRLHSSVRPIHELSSSIQNRPGVFELHRRGAFRNFTGAAEGEEFGHVADPVFLVDVPIDRILAAHLDAEGSLRRKAQDWIVAPGPLLGKEADIQRYARERAEHPDTVLAGTQHHREMPLFVDPIRVVARLGILNARQQQILPALLLRWLRHGASQSRRHVEDRIDDVGVVDLVGADQRGVDRAWRLALQEMVKNISLFQQIAKRGLWVPILRADNPGEIFPPWILGVSWRIERMLRDVAEAARHGDPKRSHELRIRVDSCFRVVITAASLDAFLPIASRPRGVLGLAEEVRV